LQVSLYLSSGVAVLAAITVWVSLTAWHPRAVAGNTVFVLVVSISVVPLYVASVTRAMCSGFQDFGLLLKVNMVYGVSVITGTAVVAVTSAGLTGFAAVALAANAFVACIILI